MRLCNTISTLALNKITLKTNSRQGQPSYSSTMNSGLSFSKGWNDIATKPGVQQNTSLLFGLAKNLLSTWKSSSIQHETFNTIHINRLGYCKILKCTSFGKSWNKLWNKLWDIIMGTISSHQIPLADSGSTLLTPMLQWDCPTDRIYVHVDQVRIKPWCLFLWTEVGGKTILLLF